MLIRSEGYSNKLVDANVDLKRLIARMCQFFTLLFPKK